MDIAISRRRLMAAFAATAFAAASLTLVLASRADAATAGKTCKPKGAVYQTSEITLLCAQTPSDSKYRWREITIAGPAGPQGLPGPPGPAGPAGSGGEGQTARYIEVPYEPELYTHRFVEWEKVVSGGTAYWQARYETVAGVGTLSLRVPAGVRVLRAEFVTYAECGARPCYDFGDRQAIGMQPIGASTYTWEGTPIDATSFEATTGIYEDSTCDTVPDDSAVCPAFESSLSGVDFSYGLRLLVDTESSVPDSWNTSFVITPTPTPTPTMNAPTATPTPSVTLPPRPTPTPPSPSPTPSDPVSP